MTAPAPKGNHAWIGLGLAALVAAAWLAFKMPGMGRDHLIAANEAAALDALRHLAKAQAEWRRNDGDGNALPDYWTGDVSGLYRAAAPDGSPAGMIPAELAAADAAPLAATSGSRPRLGPAVTPKPWKGYRLRALKTLGGAPLATDGPDDDTNAWENLRAWAVVAAPVQHGESGRRTFVVREDGIVWAKDVGATAVEDFPADPAAAGWMRAE